MKRWHHKWKSGRHGGPAKSIKAKRRQEKKEENIQKRRDEKQNDRVIDAMATIFSSGATIGAFFAGFALNIVVSASASERHVVRRYAAICALLFVLLVLTCGAGGVVFAYYKSEFLPIMAWMHKTEEEKKKDREDEKQAKQGKSTFKQLMIKWRPPYLWGVFGLIPTFLFSILTAGVYFFFLVMREYEPDVAFAGLAAIGIGTVIGGIGWLCLLHSYTPGIRTLFGDSPETKDSKDNSQGQDGMAEKALDNTGSSSPIRIRTGPSRLAWFVAAGYAACKRYCISTYMVFECA